MGIEVTKCIRNLRLKVKSEAYGWLNGFDRVSQAVSG
jgi:hypothetical protein